MHVAAARGFFRCLVMIAISAARRKIANVVLSSSARPRLNPVASRQPEFRRCSAMTVRYITATLAKTNVDLRSNKVS